MNKFNKGTLAAVLAVAVTGAEAADCPATETQFQTINPTNIFNNLVRMDGTPAHASPPYPQVEVTLLAGGGATFGTLQGVIPFNIGFNVFGDSGAGLQMGPGSLGFSGNCGMKLNRLHAYSLDGGSYDVLLTAVSLDENQAPQIVYKHYFSADSFLNPDNTSQIDLPADLGNLSVSYFLLNGWNADTEVTMPLSDQIGFGPIRTIFTETSEIAFSAPVPIPSAAILLGCGLAGLTLVTRRKQATPA